jgi:RNA polymerase sigma-70 factor (ECF subfamily)
VELEDVFRTYQRPVFTYFYRVVGRRDAAEELTQETFARACSAAVRYRGDGPISHWLFAIARRVLLEASRKGLFDRPLELDPDAPAASEVDHEARLDLEAAFAMLRPLDREALMLVDYLGYEPVEAARLVGVERSAFRMRLLRARARLRGLIEDGT